MVLDELPVILLNWTEKEGAEADVRPRYIETVRSALALVKNATGTFRLYGVTVARTVTEILRLPEPSAMNFQ
jgi:hypothetical protein